MFRKILSVIFAIFMFLPNAHSAEMVNVEYIHQYLNIRWGIDLPYNPELTNPRVAANMKYLLTVVDIANEYLNGDKTTDYGNSEYATLAAADTVATNTAIDTLVKAPPFTITTTPDTSSFSMIIGAAGNFTIDWGDGQSEVITDKPIGTTTYSHTYTTSGEYEIKLTGRATDYSDAKIDMGTGAGLVPTFALTDIISGAVIATNVAKISGSLGKIFPTMDDGTNPNFIGTFMMAPITEIPADLFAGIRGAPAAGMFANTFYGSAITSIPADLFAGIRGAPAEIMFATTFAGTAITSIPANLFAGVQGAPAEMMFANTFAGTAITSIPANLFGTLNGDGAPGMFNRTFSECPNLTTVDGPLFSGTLTPAERMFEGTFERTAITEIPADLFAGIQGAPAEEMFSETFSGSTITSIPANLFGTLNGDGAPSMFERTFYNCENLTTADGPLFSGTITPAERMFYNTFFDSAITSIPADLFAGVQGAPAEMMFANTFAGTAITSIPANLFGTLNGDGAPGMFNRTFSECPNLTTVDGPLFSGTLTPAERMFEGTFERTAITEIPADLFAGIQGAPAEEMFSETFSGSTITSIPANLFGTLNGDGAPSMFERTFYNCENLTTADGPLFSGTITPAERMFYNTFFDSAITSIPADLFAGIRGAPAEGMFGGTFYSTDITSIPENLFAGISGPAATNMFGLTFAYCTSLTGPSARTNGQYLYEIWPNVAGYMGTYSYATGLSDYDQIPDYWK